MKTKRLLLCLLMSVALTLTFIPTISFGIAENEFAVNFEEGECVQNPETSDWYVQMEHGTIIGVNGMHYEALGESGGFYASAGETVTLSAVPEEGYSCIGAYCYKGTGDSEEDYIEINEVEKTGSERKYSFVMPAEAVTVGAWFYHPIDINDCGTIVLDGWTKGEDSDSEYIWVNENEPDAKAILGGEIYYFDEDTNPHIPIDNGATLTIIEPDGKHVSEVKINGEVYAYERWQDVEFTVKADTVVEGVRTPGNNISIAFEDDYTFEELTPEVMNTAEEIGLGDEKSLDIKEKDGLFKFIPEVDGKYVFYSRVSGEQGTGSADPVLRVSDETGTKVDDDVYGGWEEYQNFYFDGKAGETYYLQATNFMTKDAVFAVGLVENDIKNMTFEKTAPGWQLRAEIDTWSDEKGVMHWDYPQYDLGDKLTLTKADGTTETYVYSEIKEAGYNDFVNESGEALAGWPYVETGADWDVDHHVVGSTVDVPISYAGWTVEAPVAFVANPFSDLVIKTPNEQRVNVENVDEGYEFIWDLTGVTFTFTEGEQTIDYVYTDGELVNDATGDSFYISNPMYTDEYHWGETEDEEGGYVRWETGGEYVQPVKAAGFTKGVPIKVVAHQHTMTKEDEVPATCSWEGTHAYYSCDKCWNWYWDEEGTQMVEKYSDLEIPIDPDAHSFKTLYEPATVTEEGSSVQECEYCGATKNPKTIYSPKTFKFAKATYTGKKQKPKLTIKDSKGNKIAASNYTVTYPKKSTNAGTYKVTITFKGKKYAGKVTKSYKIAQKANPLKVKAKTATVKGASKGKNGTLQSNKTLNVKKVIKTKKVGKGKMSYIKASGNKKITINKKTGKVTVKKGLKKGTYKVKVKVKAAGNTNFKASKVFKLTIKIKVK